MGNWTPLEDCWQEYQTLLDEAYANGWLEDPDLAEKYAYPSDLRLASSEKEELGRFTVVRVEEVLHFFDQMGAVSPKLMGLYIQNAVLAGMLWERQRIGR